MTPNNDSKNENKIEPSIQSTGLGHSPGQDSKGPGTGVAGVKTNSAGLETDEAKAKPVATTSEGRGYGDNAADSDLATNDDVKDAADTP